MQVAGPVIYSVPWVGLCLANKIFLSHLSVKFVIVLIFLVGHRLQVYWMTAVHLPILVSYVFLLFLFPCVEVIDLLIIFKDPA